MSVDVPDNVRLPRVNCLTTQESLSCLQLKLSNYNVAMALPRSCHHVWTGSDAVQSG